LLFGNPSFVAFLSAEHTIEVCETPLAVTNLELKRAHFDRKEIHVELENRSEKKITAFRA